MTPEKLLHAVRLAILSGKRVTVGETRIAGARLSTSKEYLVLYHAADENSFLAAIMDDGRAVTTGIWPGDRNWQSIVEQVSH